MANGQWHLAGSKQAQHISTTSKFCVRCHKRLGLIGKLTSDPYTGYCRDCYQSLKPHFDSLRSQFVSFISDNFLSGDEWQYLMNQCYQLQISQAELCRYIHQDAFAFVGRLIAGAKGRGMISEEERRVIWALESLFMLDPTEVQIINDDVTFLGYLTDIRSGRLPIIQASIVVQAGETAHYEGFVRYQKSFGDSAAIRVTNVDGRIVITSKRLLFVAPSGGFEVSLSKIANVELAAYNAMPIGIVLELTRKIGNGLYVPRDLQRDPLVIVAILHTLVEISNRQFVYTSGTPSRHIAQDVKIAVWHRDRGRCVQCDSDQYLEFDHIIPFSKGGASTVTNVQLLCRRCNLAKGDRL